MNEKINTNEGSGNWESFKRRFAAFQEFFAATREQKDANKEALEELVVESLETLAANTKRIVLAGTLLTMAAAVVDFETTKYEMTLNDKDGSIDPVHSDKETTEILNWITGKASLPPELRLMLERAAVSKIFSDQTETVPAEVATDDEDGLRKILVARYQAMYKKYGIPAKEADTMAEHGANNTLYDAAPTFTYNKELESTLWQIELDSGAPRIRFTGQDNVAWQKIERDTHHPAWYDHVSNTMYIEMDASPFTNYFAEDAHAFQTRNSPIPRALQSIDDFIGIGWRMLVKWENFEKSYNETYEIPGSVEYVAHKFIEPALRAEFYNELPQKRELQEMLVRPKPNPLRA